MKTPTGKDQPLKAEVVDGRIVISVGVETLKFCHNETEKQSEGIRGFGSGFFITEAEEFAKDVVRELKREREDGSSPLTDLFDKFTIESANQGSMHTEERFDWFCEYCERGFPKSFAGYLHTNGKVYCSEDCVQ